MSILRKFRWLCGGIAGSVFLFFIFMGCSMVFAAPDQELTYHGKLTDNLGLAVPNGNYDFTLTIYDAASGGACLWTARGTCGTPTPKILTVTNGIFSTVLGEAGDNGLNVAFDANYYLEIKIGTNAPMSPRRKITPTGFALNAHRLNGQEASYYTNATNLTGTIPSAVLQNSTVYIGTTSIPLNRTSGNVVLTGITSIDGLAARATNLAGGNGTTMLGAIPYQSNTNTTTLLAPNTTTNKRFLRMTGTGVNGAAPAWDAVTATDVGLDNVTNAAQLVASTTSTQSGYFGDVYLASDVTPANYLSITHSGNLTGARSLALNVNDANRSVSLSGNLTVSGDATVSGTNTGDQTSVSGNAGTVTITADDATNATEYPLFVSAATGGLSPRTDTGYTYNPSTGLLTSVGFSGNGSSLANLTAANLSGTIPSAVLGNSTVYIGTTSMALNRTSGAQALTGISSIDGTASALTTARTIQGVSFNGTTNINIINGTGFVKATGTTLSYDNSTYLTANQTITLTGDVTGSGTTSFATTIAANSVALTTDTTGDYVAGNTAGNGIGISGTAGEGWSPTVALGNLTANWSQTGAFDIVLANAASELQILESTGATYYGIFDVGDLSVSNQTYTFTTGGTVYTTGSALTGYAVGSNAAIAATDTILQAFGKVEGQINAKSLAIGNTVTSATTGSIFFAGASSALAQDNVNFFWDDVNNNLGIGTNTPVAMLSLYGVNNKLRFSYDAANYSEMYANSSGSLVVEGSGTPTEQVVVIGAGSSQDISVKMDGFSQDYYAGLDYETGSYMIGSGSTVGSNAIVVLTAAGMSTGARITSTLATGTSPFAVTSTTVNANLNADLLDGQHSTYYRNATNINAGTLASTYGGTGLASAGTAGNLLRSTGAGWESWTPDYLSATTLTDAVVTGKALTGYAVGTDEAIAATDTIVQAFGKVQAQIDAMTLSGGGMAVGGGITSATPGSVFFAGPGGVLAQDNPNFFWDDAANRLGIGTTTPGAMLSLFGVNNKLRFAYDGSNYADISVDSTGQLLMNSSSGVESGMIVGSGVAQDTSIQYDGYVNDFFAGIDDNTGLYSLGVGTSVASSSTITGPGTVTNTAGGTTVTGTNTRFTTTFRPGSTITIGAQTVTVSTVTNDTTMITSAITAANTNATYTYSGGTRMVLEPSGNIGIGALNPSALLEIGTAGSLLGTLRLAGNTSGYTQIQPAASAVAGDWTMVLPTGVGTTGYQLTTNVSGSTATTSWTAASSVRDTKNIDNRIIDPTAALDTILSANVYNFHYKQGMGTGDSQTQYVGIMADEAPWAMHYDGQIINPVNTLGYMILGFQAENKKISAVKDQYASLALTTGTQSSKISALQEKGDENIKILANQIDELKNRVNGQEKELNGVVDGIAKAQAGIDVLMALSDDDIEKLSTFLELTSQLFVNEEGNVEVNGVVKVEKVVAGEVEVAKLTIAEDDDATIGTTVVCPEGLIVNDEGCREKNSQDGNAYEISDGKSVVVKTDAVTEESTVFTSFEGDPGASSWVEKEEKDGDFIGFTIKLGNAVKEAVKVHWWVVDAK